MTLKNSSLKIFVKLLVDIWKLRKSILLINHSIVLIYCSLNICVYILGRLKNEIDFYIYPGRVFVYAL